MAHIQIIDGTLNLKRTTTRFKLMKCLIVDDNKIARTTLKQLASQVIDLEVVGDSPSAVDAYNFVRRYPVDLLLLDIEMPGMNGLELTKNLTSKKPLIIFITSEKSYATDAFDLNVVDFIVKPVTPARFFQAINKAREIMERGAALKTADPEFIFIRDSNIIRRLKLDDILFAEAMGDYVKLYTSQKFYAVHTTLKAIEERLRSFKFIRVHRSFVVSVSKIDTIQGGTLTINSKPIPVADAYRAALNKQMKVI